MKLTRTADFALKVLVYLSGEKELITMPVLSQKLAIPYNNLSKLVQTLAKAQIVQTKQGKNGGLKLLKKAENISVKMIVDLIDGPTNLADCIGNSEFCKSNKTCRLKGKLKYIQNKIDEVLEEVKIG